MQILVGQGDAQRTSYKSLQLWAEWAYESLRE